MQTLLIAILSVARPEVRVSGGHGDDHRSGRFETQPREGRFEYDFDEGDLRRWRRLDPDASPWWTLIRHPQVSHV
jgi:hypothetical protein